MEITNSLREKIDALFDLRMIPWLLDSGNMVDRGAFLEKLIKLQVSIYALDHHLETNWILTRKDLKPFWITIYRDLEGFGLTDYQQRTWSSEIMRYQTRELALRRGLSPARHPMKALYYYKSCDVRLMRNLIYREAPDLEQIMPFGNWHEFDLITEVNDDVEDIYEDLEILNGNRFLFSLFEFGMESSEERYRSFVEEQAYALRVRLENRQDIGSRFIVDSTESVAQYTNALLLDRMQQIQPSLFEEARVIQEFNRVKMPAHQP